MSDHSFKKKARQHQQATGDSYSRARRQVDKDHTGPPPNPGAVAASSAAVPESATAPRMLSLLGLDPNSPDFTALWAAHQLPVGTNSSVDLGPLLRVPLGLRAGGEPVWLDIKEQGAGGDGPHGLLVGAEGSGKSTTLQAILFALCAQHSPDLLQLVLVDGHESSCFADFDTYPHTAANLNAATAATAAIVALQDLIDQRREALRWNRDIREYNELRAAAGGSDLPAVPYTLVVVDELPVLLRADPGFTPVLSRLFREGRSLGIHVLLAGTHLDPLAAADAHLAIDRRFAVNARYRIGLRAETAEASRQVIGRVDAYHLPPSPGLGVFCANLRADPVPYRGFQIPQDLVRKLGRRPDAGGS
ncbi:MAG: FtsK/SpoIIIE domain-containing protein [Mycolicibacterium sp.]|uniref:FtsK/SpoIIIE domain-containing protein n=1 Tax=Mycolicibacterium sp. TaxID=2320850 RepID=UPI003D09C869